MFIQPALNAGRNLCKQATNYVSDSQVLKKTGQVFASTLALVFTLDPTKQKSLLRLTNVVLSINLIDGFHFLKLPQALFLSITADSINEFTVTDALTHMLLRRSHPNESVDKIPENVKNRVYLFAQGIVKAQLNAMSENEEDACSSIGQFQERLMMRLRKTPPPQFDKIDLKGLPTQDFKDSVQILGLENSLLRPARLLDRIAAVIWVTVDIGSVFCYLKDWKLLDTAKLAMNMGQCSVLSFIKEMDLELFVLGSVFVGYTLDVIESIRKLHDERVSLSPQQKMQAYRTIVTSSLEAILFAGIYVYTKTGGVAINPCYLQVFAIISRLVGIAAALTRPQHEFFQKPRPVVEDKPPLVLPAAPATVAVKALARSNP